MTKDEALKLTLEVIEAIHTVGNVACVVTPNGAIYLQPSITAIKEALAQQEQEPVCDKDPQGCWSVRCQLGNKCKNTPPKVNT